VKKKKYCYLFSALLLISSCASNYLLGFTDSVKIGTASFSGAYYPTGGALSKIANKYNTKDFSKAVSSKGSTENINNLLGQRIHIGLAQADRHYEAYFGLEEWKEKGPQSKLRSIFSLYPQTINLIATKSSGIKTLKDLKGHRVNLGAKGSGDLGNALAILKILNLDPERDLRASYHSISKMLKQFEKGYLDAFFYTIGYPSMVLNKAARVQRVNQIPLVGIDSFLMKNPYYQTVLIPDHAYPSMTNSKDRIESIGVMTTVLTTTDIPEAIIYKFTKAIFDHLDEFKAEHSVLYNLNKLEMLKGLSAPLHPGARRYYEEIGLLNEYDPIKRLFN
jgi:uncharacterized protein